MCYLVSGFWSGNLCTKRLINNQRSMICLIDAAACTCGAVLLLVEPLDGSLVAGRRQEGLWFPCVLPFHEPRVGVFRGAPEKASNRFPQFSVVLVEVGLGLFAGIPATRTTD